MGNVLFAPEIPGSAGTEVYEKPATARLPLRCRYVDHCDELHDNPDEDVTPNTIADITRVRSALSNDYGKGLTASQFVNEIVKSLPRYFHGDPSYMAVLLLKLIQRESGDVEIINFDDLIELADLMESCNTPDDRLAFALYVISSCNPKDILEQSTEFPAKEVKRLMRGIIELKGDRFGRLVGSPAKQFAKHVCDVLDSKKNSRLTLGQLIAAYESSPFYEEILCF